MIDENGVISENDRGSGEKKGFSTMPIWLRKWALFTHHLRFSCESFLIYI